MPLLITAVIVGIILLVLSIRTFLSVKRGDPIGAFRLESGTYEFDITVPGFYSVAIVGAGHVRQKGQTAATLTISATREVEVNKDSFKIRSTYDGRISTDYWNFVCDVPGHVTLTLSNVETLEIGESMLSSSRLLFLFPLNRMLEKPIAHTRLGIHVYRSVPALQRLLAVLATLVGGWLVIGSLVLTFDGSARESFFGN